MQYTVKFNPQEPDNLDLYAVTTDGNEVLVLQDVVEAGCKWAVGEMGMVDGSDADQVRMLAADLRRRMPLKYSYAWRQAEYNRLANLPLRRCNGQFKSQGAR